MVTLLACLGACKQDVVSQKVNYASPVNDLQGGGNSVSQVKNSKGSESTAVNSAVKESVSIPQNPESVDIQRLAVEFKEGMPYGDLRKSVIAGNWKPKTHPECKKNVIGDDFESVCSKSPQQCLVCDQLPELDVCSGDGHCITEFSSNDGRKVLKVSTYGEIADGLVEGEKSRLFVSWWDVSPKAD
ncbi:hypothetical protein [Xanthomonas campestris]|uniref:hypothetical protein n=1 Tax=Xanthomonas campestris TaxID=339 RepID=UPI0011C05A1A|nr:hypothetical protein [Xanthomonas campestris]